MMERMLILEILVVFCFQGLCSFTTKGSYGFHRRFLFKSRIQAQEEPLFIDSRPDPNWWLLFDADQKNVTMTNVVDVHQNDTETTTVPENWKPNIGAWRAALQPVASGKDTNISPSSIEQPVVELLNDEVPPTLYQYLNGLKPLGEKHENNVKELWDAMKKNIRRLSEEDLQKVTEAFRIAYIALWGQQTIRSLEISIQRARGTAAVLGQLRADVTIILAGILSDVLVHFDTHPYADTINEHLYRRFGSEVIDLCLKYNRLPVFMSKKTDYTPIQSENQLQMLVAVAEDYRVLYIRLADRLHTMRILRTLSLSELEQRKLAQEALNVYAPLAHRMGVMKVKGELEDLAFKALNPLMFKDAKYAQVAAYKHYYDLCVAMENITREDNDYLKTQGASCKVIKRIKDKYQLALKMQRKNLTSSSQVRDALGIRIIVDHVWRINKGPQGNTRESEEEYINRGHDICYHIIQELRTLSGWAPAQFKDYIKNPKGNGYQSLHQYIRNVAVNEYVEIQVRTRAMHIQAELGEPAHWYYKDQIYRREIAETKIYRQAWRSPTQLLAKSAVELLTLARQQLLASRVYVFLDDCSTVLNLQKGATVLDAAFALHSDVGLTLANVRIGDKIAGLNRVLQNKLVVSFESSSDKSVTVKPQWLDIVTTNSGQSTIRKYFREHQRGMLVCLGCVQLLMCMTLSTNVMNQRYPKKLPDAAKLSYWAMKRSQCDISEVLAKLGTSSKTEAMHHIGGLLDISAKSLTVSSISLGLIWARMQGKNGWEEKLMQRTILIPLMTQILPSMMNNNISRSINATAGVNIEQMWIELVGGRSLIEEDEPDALKSVEKLSLPFIAVSPERSGQELDFSIPYVIQPPPSVTTTTPSTSIITSTTTSSSMSTSSNKSLQRPLKVSMRSPLRAAALYKNATMSAKATSSTPRTPSFDAVFDPDLFGITHPNESSSRQVYHPKIFYTSTYSSSTIENGYLNIDTGARINKSPVSLLRQPYALEAPSLSIPLLKMAKKNYSQRELSRGKALCQGQRSFT